MKVLIRILAWIGALSGAVNLVLTFVLIGMYAIAGKELESVRSYSLITMLFTIAPLQGMVRYELDLEPIISPSHTVKRFVRFTTFGLILLAVASLILGMIGKFEQYVNGYGVLLEASLLGSWVCLTWYVYGIRVMYSEKALAIARHPWFLFDRERLKRYLEANRKEER